MTRVRVKNREIVDRCPIVARDLRPSHGFRPPLEQIQLPIQMVQRSLSAGVKRLGWGHSASTSAEMKNEWSYIYTSHTLSRRAK